MPTSKGAMKSANPVMSGTLASTFRSCRGIRLRNAPLVEPASPHLKRMFDRRALLRAQIDCAPNDSTRIAPLITAIGADVAAKGVGEGEFIGARGILRSQLKQAFRENGFLVSTLMRAQERPEETDEIVALHDGLMNTITRDEVNKWAAKILIEKNCRSAAVVPKAFVGMFEGGK